MIGSELEQSAPALVELKSVAQQASEALATAEGAVQAWSQNWDGFNERAREPSQTAEVQQSRITYLEQVLTKLQERLQQQRAEWESLAATTGDTTGSPLGAKIEEADRKIAAFESEISRLKEQLAVSHTSIEQSRQQQDDIRASIQETRGLMSSLVALQEAASASRSSGLECLDQVRRCGPMAPCTPLEVEPGWEGAIEQVLSEALSLDSDEQSAGCLAGYECVACWRLSWTIRSRRLPTRQVPWRTKHAVLRILHYGGGQDC